MTTLGHQVELGRDDATCVSCGRRAKFDPAYGKVVHVRGRVKGLSPFRKKPAGPVTVPGRASEPTGQPVRSSLPPRPMRRRCPDCGSELQELNAGVWRCPWTRDRRQVFVDGVVACGWPHGQKPPDGP